MARPVSWLERVPAMLHTVTMSKRSRYGVAEIQTLFALQPRAARMLMKMFPRFEVGASFQVSREDLAAFLERVQAAAPQGCHHAAAKGVGTLFSQILAEAPPVTREQLALPMQPIRLTPRPQHLTSLPDSILVRRGMVQVTCKTRELLVEALVALSTIIETDEFAYAFDSPKTVERAVDPEVRGMFEELEQMEADHARSA